MKRHNNLFDKIVDKDNLLLAYKKAKKHKSWQQKVIRVEKDLDNLIEELRLSKCNLFPTSQGIDFLGYRHFSSGYILVRKTTAKRMKKRIRRLKWELAKKKITNDRALSVIGSISGWLKWANTYNLQISLQLNELKESIGGSVNEQI